MATILRRVARTHLRKAPVSAPLRRQGTEASSSVPYRTMKDEKLQRDQQILPREADVVVIGGGVAGCALTYYLTKMGVKRVVMLEKHVLTAGTTWHTNALVWHLRPSDVDIQLLKRTWDLITGLPKESGIDTNAVRNGGLFIASTKQRLDEYKRLATIGRAFGIESSVLSPSDVKSHYPQINTDDLYGALLSPADGSIDITSYCSALARVATSQFGATIINDCPVTRIETEKNSHGVPQVTAVETTRGRIKTNQAVVCAGIWSPFIVKPLGVHLPSFNVFHAYIVTGAIPNLGALPNIRDHDGSIATRTMQNYLCLGGYEPNPPIAKPEDVKVSPTDDTAFTLCDLNWDSFGCLIEAGIHRLPVLKQVGVKNTVCGFEAFTPDHKPLLGPTPEVRGLFVSSAFNAGGVMLSGGCAHELAKWIVHGSPDLDMFAYDVRRFNPVLSCNSKWVTERSHESYATNYNIVFKNEEPLAGRNQKKDVLHDTLLRDGCVYQERYGWERPAWFARDGSKAPVLDYDYYGAYGHKKHTAYRYRDFNAMNRTYEFPQFFHTVRSEALSCRNAASLFNLSSMGKFYLVGPDASRAADWLFSNDIEHKPGAVTYTLILNKRGGVEIDATVCAIQNERFDRDHHYVTERDFGDRNTFSKAMYYFVTVDTPYSAVFKDVVARELHSRKFNCSLHDVTKMLCTLSLQGPNSRKVLRQMAANPSSVDANFPNLSHKVLTHDDAEPTNYRAVRFSRTGEIGWDLHMPTRQALKFYQWLHYYGRKLGLVNAGYYALNALATEKGIPSPHTDVRPSDTPLEAGLASLCKLDGDINFLGRDALLRQNTRDLPKRLLCFTTKSNKVMLNGLETIYRNGKIVGYIRRTDFAYSLNLSIAYGYLEKHLAQEKLTDKFVRDARWQLEKMGTLYDVDAHLSSPFDSHGDRLLDELK